MYTMHTHTHTHTHARTHTHTHACTHALTCAHVLSLSLSLSPPSLSLSHTHTTITTHTHNSNNTHTHTYICTHQNGHKMYFGWFAKGLLLLLTVNLKMFVWCSFSSICLFTNILHFFQYFLIVSRAHPPEKD